MPRPKSAVPAYRLHKSSGRAVCYIGRKEHYLGVHGSPESRQKYAELISRLTGGEPAMSVTTDKPPAQHSVAKLCTRYVTERLPNYAPDEQRCQRSAIKILCSLYGESDAATFGPIALRTVRAAMVAGDPHAVDAAGSPKPRKPWSRSFTNKQVKRIRQIFKFGISWELVPASVADGLRTVESLKAGQTEAAESRPRRAVPLEDIEAVRTVLCQKHRDLIDLLLLSGARPGEIINLTTGAINRSGEIWRADLAKHKNSHRGKSRTIFFNATAQAILTRYLKADPDAPLFAIRRDTFGAAVKSACVKAGVDVWTPHWCRHTVATRLADGLGLESAQQTLGHSGAAMTRHYSQSAERLAIEAVKSLG